MNGQEIMGMAAQAELLDANWMPEELMAFAKLVAAKEREACAKVCDDIHAEHEANDVFSSYAEAIRARK